MSVEGRILVVDDHVDMGLMLREPLTDAGYVVDLATGGEEAIRMARAQAYNAVLCDLRMEGVDGLDVLEAVRALDADIPVLMMTAFGGVESAVEAMKRGAYHYFTKPFRLDEVLLFLERALKERRLQVENRALRRAAAERSGLGALVGRSAAMRNLYELIDRVAYAQAAVLLRGPSGTGKELVARALHFQGPRASGPFVAVNCTALPHDLLESELFGHLKGAFTGATHARRGLFVEADGGTLFLDEIGDMPLELQARLLRVLEDGEVRAVGADGSRTVDVRIVAATHQDLDARVREGRFRADLFYRLNVVTLLLPPLAERREDIPLLVEHFTARARARNPRSRMQSLSPEAVAALATLPWPGNVRELENLIERLAVMVASEVVGLEDLRPHLPPEAPEVQPLVMAQHALWPLRRLEAEYIAWMVTRCGGNKTRAAEVLGIDVSTIHRRERERG
ncbi:sigma-54-dependent transcriptional regulator [Myxococcus xanthus]|uniref:Sigma-54-dependent Fis family transcriptional regulator n=1 Tax=Myxococcus xanthus TaxID=34 RepID=A0AAE6G1N5_MYXXA|nr:sigma-54 dependent transcriptional regulator [Myxococcus xanthus]QDE69252.1 sigma-54-dependent Fis family transcriptional regulator [Myxococcus xanthus]QDE76529.1 sigma-54-dependent Fis family transcriptional regulator [Myxococcus xanthus]QDE83948.1 sigma-54-dependent Fis family transcriptional regulator [Myxococcus xanthus]QDE98096.1 sigma-54-dependent Fis family transcriptional regulator [Myxococcus xanthus]QDF05804.1 sigma-54-dependent Fis family transcriptional regulator [Myxococcus xan